MRENVMRTLLVSLLLLAAVAVCAQSEVPNELKRLEAALAVAQSQMDLNQASDALARYWDRQLIKAEQKLRRELDAEAVELFQKTARAWREYRLTQVAFEADRYRGGSIRPLIRNTTFATITERRVKEIELLYEENL
jgi:uncharacterized protein YecT (DUF1311 family)